MQHGSSFYFEHEIKPVNHSFNVLTSNLHFKTSDFLPWVQIPATIHMKVKRAAVRVSVLVSCNNFNSQMNMPTVTEMEVDVEMKNQQETLMQLGFWERGQ